MSKRTSRSIQPPTRSSRPRRAIAELEAIRTILIGSAGYGADRVRIDPSVVRGLEYYTGPVYEVELTFEIKDEEGRPVRFGSVGGGGRYDGLVGALPRRARAGDRLFDRRVAPAGGAHASRQGRDRGRAPARSW